MSFLWYTVYSEYLFLPSLPVKSNPSLKVLVLPTCAEKSMPKIIHCFLYSNVWQKFRPSSSHWEESLGGRCRIFQLGSIGISVVSGITYSFMVISSLVSTIMPPTSLLDQELLKGRDSRKSSSNHSSYHLPSTWQAGKNCFVSNKT